MKILMMKLLMYLSTSISMLKTPMSMGVVLLIQTIMSTLLISKVMLSSWIPMVIFLMFIGGLLIIFMYMSSIASNEKFKVSIKMMLMFLLIAFIPMDEMINELQISELMKNQYTNEYISLTKIYNKKTLSITILMFMYMFLTMVVVTSIIKIFKGPLRAKM